MTHANRLRDDRYGYSHRIAQQRLDAADHIDELEADKSRLVTAIERWVRERHASDWVAVIINDDGDLQVIHEDPYDDDWIVATEDGAS